MKTGIVKMYNADRGLGFIQPDGGSLRRDDEIREESPRRLRDRRTVAWGCYKAEEFGVGVRAASRCKGAHLGAAFHGTLRSGLGWREQEPRPLRRSLNELFGTAV
jgi:cold shock CspA family protein